MVKDKGTKTNKIKIVWNLLQREAILRQVLEDARRYS